MNKKIMTAILCSITILSAGCGSQNDSSEEAKRSDAQENIQKDMKDTQKIEWNAQETEQGVGESSEAEETSITVTSVQVNKDTKSICVEARLSGGEDLEQERTGIGYSVEGVQVLRTESDSAENSFDVKWYGFYEEEDAFQNIKIGKTFSDGQTKTVENEAGVEEVPAKKFDVSVGDSTVPVWVTPFALLISPTEDWREDGEFYNLFAIDTGKTRHYICSLPMMDDRKPSQQRDDPLENPDVENLNELGDGLAFSVELEHCGVQSVFNEDIDLDQIEQLEILCYHRTGE